MGIGRGGEGGAHPRGAIGQSCCAIFAGAASVLRGLMRMRSPTPAPIGAPRCPGPCPRAPKVDQDDPLRDRREARASGSPPSACALSSAGRIPSSAASRCSAAIASASVADAYSTRPEAAQRGVLRADAGVVQAGRDAVRFDDLPSSSWSSIAVRAVQHAGPSRGERRACRPRVGPRPPASTPMRRTVRRPGTREQADGVAAAADAGDGEVRQPPVALERSARAPRGRSRSGSRAPCSGTGAGPATEPST